MISRIFIIFLITATVKCLNYDRVPRLVKNKTVDYRVSLRQILRLPEVNRPPFNLFKSREEFVKLAEQNINNYKPYNYKLYRPYNPFKPAFIYDRDYVTKVLSSLGLLRPLQNVPSNPRNTSESDIKTGMEENSSPEPVNNSFVTSESNGIETITIGNSNEDINTTTNSYAVQTTDAAVSVTEDAERTTELTTESFEFSTYTTEGTNIPNYSTTESVAESNRIESTTNSNIEETILTATDSYTKLTSKTEDSSTVNERTIVESSTDSFGIANTTDILSYSSTEPASNAETQYTTEISTTEGLDLENENVLLTGSNRVETTTTSSTKDGFNPTTTDDAAFITQFGHVPTSIAEDMERIAELTTESFRFSTHIAEGTNIPYYFTTETVTESNRINQTKTGAKTEETIFTTTDSYTTLTSNTEDSSTVDEGIIVQSSTDSLGIANTTDILKYSSTEPVANAETKYTTEILTTERIDPENENLYLTGSNRGETTTTSNTQDCFNPTTPGVAAFITQFGQVPTSIVEDTERTTELTTESFGFSTYTTEGTNIPNYSTTESVSDSIRIESATNSNTEETILTTTDSYTTLTSKTEDSSTADERTIVQSSTDSFGIANTTDILSYSSTEPVANAENQYTTESLTTERIEPENENVLLTGSNLVETTTTSNTQDGFNPTTPDVAAFITQFGHVSTSIAEDTERTTELTTESFRFSTYTAEGTNIPYYFTTETVTEPNRINQTTTDANTEETIVITTDSYTTLTSNTVDSSTVYEGTIVQSSTDSFVIANTTDILSSTKPASNADTQYTTEISTSVRIDQEPVANAENQYTTEISTTERIDPENENLLITGSNLVETTTTSSTKDGFNPTTTDDAAFITQFGHVPTSIAEDTERIAELTTERFGFPPNTAQGTNFPNYPTTKSITESNRIESTTDVNREKTIYTTTDSYTVLAPNAEDSSTADEEILTQFSTTSFGIATTTDILSFTSTEPATNAETQYTTEISTTDCIESENEHLLFTDANRVETTITSNTEDVNPTTDSYTEQATDAAFFKTTTENFSTLNALDVEKTTELTTPSVWTSINRVDGTDILDYSTNEPVTSAETTTLSLEPDNGYLLFTFSNQVETANTEQGIHTTTDSPTEQTVDSITTLAPNLTEEPITELTMESWRIETTTKADIPKYSTTESVIFKSTMNPNDTMMFTIENLTTETNRMETITTANENSGIHTTTSEWEDQTTANPTKTTHEIENYTTFGVVDVESTTLGRDIEPASQICEETTKSENFSETIVQSETDTAEKFVNVTSTTDATEITTSIDVTTELNEKTTVNILNGNSTEQEPIVFSTTDTFNVEDSIGTTTQISKEIESLADLLLPTTESYYEVSTQAFDFINSKDTTDTTTNVVHEFWNMSTTPLQEDITTRMYEVSSTSALMDNSFTQNALLSTITELPTLSTTEGNREIITEISQTECATEIIEQVEETTMEAEATVETFEKSTTELMLTEISSIETATERSLENVIENDKGTATARVLLTDDTTARETVDNILKTYNEVVPETFEQSTNELMTTSFQEYTTEVMDVNTTEFYKENTTKQIDYTTPISLVEDSTTASPMVTTEHLIDVKSNTVDNKSNEENSVTSSNHLGNTENPSIEPLYNRQQKLAIKALKESSKRKAKKFNYDTDVMPSLGDYDYI